MSSCAFSVLFLFAALATTQWMLMEAQAMHQMIRMFLHRGHCFAWNLQNLNLLAWFFFAAELFCFPYDFVMCRMEAFEAILGQHVLANHVDQMSIDEVEQTVNRDAAVAYTRGQVEFILEVWFNSGFSSVRHRYTSLLYIWDIKIHFSAFFRGCKMQTG